MNLLKTTQTNIVQMYTNFRFFQLVDIILDQKGLLLSSNYNILWLSKICGILCFLTHQKR